LRKEYHPGLAYTETANSSSFNINAILTTKFQMMPLEQRLELDPFFEDVFKQPTVTVSYLNNTVFYTTSVEPKKVYNCSAAYEWNYKDSLIKNDENTFANYCEYSFSTSWAMPYKKYFHPKYSVEGFDSRTVETK